MWMKCLLPHIKPMRLSSLPFCRTTCAARCFGRQMAADKSMLQMFSKNEFSHFALAIFTCKRSDALLLSGAAVQVVH